MPEMNSIFRIVSRATPLQRSWMKEAIGIEMKRAAAKDPKSERKPIRAREKLSRA